LGNDFEARGRSAPSVKTAAGIQTAAVFAYAFVLLLSGTDGSRSSGQFHPAGLMPTSRSCIVTG
jgi:hypothetical protein